MSEFGKIDILFVAHGVGAHKFFEDTTEEELSVYRKTMDINFHSHTHICHAALTPLKKSKG
jgi:NAD(P)-dependent dehydrogenase (short-subunit alcohol dehydrogenase family)